MDGLHGQVTANMQGMFVNGVYQDKFDKNVNSRGEQQEVHRLHNGKQSPQCG